jgi:hypothetical protein
MEINVWDGIKKRNDTVCRKTSPQSFIIISIKTFIFSQRWIL